MAAFTRERAAPPKVPFPAKRPPDDRLPARAATSSGTSRLRWVNSRRVHPQFAAPQRLGTEPLKSRCRPRSGPLSIRCDSRGSGRPKAACVDQGRGDSLLHCHRRLMPAAYCSPSGVTFSIWVAYGGFAPRGRSPCLAAVTTVIWSMMGAEVVRSPGRSPEPARAGRAAVPCAAGRQAH